MIKTLKHSSVGCLCCQQTQPVRKEKITSSWPKTLYPFQRVHIDFFSYSAKEVLILSDAHTKYCDVFSMSSTTLSKVLEKLVDFFCVFGLPTELVSDNGPPFQSKGLEIFCKMHGIILTHSPPYHPSSNGQAERAVRTIKNVFFKFCLGVEDLPLDKRLQKFKLYHNNSPSTVTGKTPSELIFAFKPKTLLDLATNIK